MLDIHDAICDGLVCIFNSGNVVYSKKQVSHGRWYFEVHHNGGNFMFTAGFSIPGNFEGISYFPYKYYNNGSGDGVIYYPKYINSSEIAKDGSMNTTSFIENQTYGIGIDIDSNLFFVQSAKEIRRYQFNVLTKPPYKWNAYVSEAIPKTYPYKDSITLNFGLSPFELPIPYGFQPYSSNFIDYCKTLKSCMNLPVSHTFLYVIITI
ncbi:hypothetical protein TVAGG3_0444920 [Trichomonas vaginalis G3]|uniref:hypothetical protein n=1 Tax=Trichomonas vaginalis (strain ATCC PRA-98 / G3) TaxID=412133 RepID=UPI0021E594EB|nr:hypothetical protein TVAGG3_0444920 [Trichomonas vaginalis G3]KAI5537725.1 hypothetical protein TVAGG3_0444920 [Trichomonas vaginalis G3]